ncbi:MAG: hypothetical protein CM15mP62_13700 [Rhodospirillaceae bacterium]|nr:MAG: hypothetical protein CM15mP62_13700 [Rhodospirillaceae bacterium]
MDPHKSLVPNTFDLIITNPPYLESNSSNPSPEKRKNSANVETEVDLGTWLNFSAKFLKPGGNISLIHRADRLDHILTLMRTSFGGLSVYPLWPKTGRPAKRVIVSGIKGSASPTKILPGATIHDADGSYTAPVQAALTGEKLLADLLN